MADDAKLRTASDLHLQMAQQTLAWLRRKGPLFCLPDLYRLGPPAIRDKATATSIVGVLADHGYVERVSGGAELDGKYRRDYLSALFGWAVKARFMTANPARDAEHVGYATDGFHWGVEEVRQFEERHPIGKAIQAHGRLRETYPTGTGGYHRQECHRLT
jgi:hypothetical protein